RPSIDVLFESAARVWKDHLVGIVLTGANEDGAAGLHSIAQSGGLTVVQDPKTAESPEMPRAAMALVKIDHLRSPTGIGELLAHLVPYRETVSDDLEGAFVGDWQ
ncbi:MAG: chemotaxis protein CheB, partial [Sedimenticola sp.]